MKSRHAVLLTLLACLSLMPRQALAGDTVLISAAMSLRSAFEQIGARLAASEDGVRTVFNFGASADLAAQIHGGAAVDVFAAADAKEMDRLDTQGELMRGTRVDFAANRVVVVVPIASAAGISVFADLTSPAIARIAIANPKTAPAGRYAEEVFAGAGVAAAVRPKLILAENVRQVLDYVGRGEVDAGVVYATDAMIRAREVRVAAVAPEGSHRPAVYPIAVLKGSTHPEAAKGFVDAVRSEAGQAILARHGFTPVPVSP